VRDASQLIFGVRPLPRSKDNNEVFEGVSSIGTPSPTLSMAYRRYYRVIRVSREPRQFVGRGSARRATMRWSAGGRGRRARSGARRALVARAFSI